MNLAVRRPSEGWLPVVLVGVIVAIVAYALDDPAWVIGRGVWTDFLPLAAILGAVVGFVGPKVGWPRWITHVIGAMFAALILPILAGWALEPTATPGHAFAITADGSIEAYLDLAWRHRGVTQQVAHFLLTLGILAWATGQFTSYAVFGHRRPINAVIVPGIVLVANISLTTNDELVHLVIFTIASLLLLMSMHALNERSTWIRRRIGDPSQLSQLYLRGGSVFVAIAIVGALLLTGSASSAPLAGAWSRVDQRLLDVGQQIQRILPIGGAQRSVGVSFEGTASIHGSWTTSDGVAFKATLPPGQDPKLYWRAGTWDKFELSAWSHTPGTDRAIEAGTPALDGTIDAPDPGLTKEIDITVTPQDFNGRSILSPATPYSVDRNVTLQTLGDDENFVSLLREGSDPYTVTASVPVLGEKGFTASKLISASTSYPQEIVDLYTDVPPGSFGPDRAHSAALALLADVRRIAGSDNPYVLASTMEKVLRDPSRFTYSTNVSDLECRDLGIAECFARFKRGFCQYYATEMAVLLREAKIPTRFVQGFLPTRPDSSGTETVLNRYAHAWVEVYFPGYGWWPFDPTGGNISNPVTLPQGSSVPSATPAPSSDSSARASIRAGRSEFDPAGGAGATVTPTSRPSSPAALIVVTVLLLGSVVAVGVATWWRGPRGELTPESAWRGVARLGTRFGFGPRPTQTVYEYAATLGQRVPAARDDLQAVATAKVETSYGRVRLTDDGLRAVRDATRRLRLSLLRLLLRRPRRRGVRVINRP